MITRGEGRGKDIEFEMDMYTLVYHVHAINHC